MGLQELQLRVSYRSDQADLVNDFYVPCLERARSYRRAVGYFTSGGLSVAAQGIARLLANGGRMELVASPRFNGEDIAAIEKGYEERSFIIRRTVARSFEDIKSKLISDRLSALAWLVSEGVLDIRLAFAVNPFGVPTRGLYHEKIGIFLDADGNTVAFSGSSNETMGGLVDNFEAIDVYWSWDDRHGRVSEKVDAFDRLWNNTTERLEVLDFTEVAAEVLEPYKTDEPPQRDPAQKKVGVGSASGDVEKLQLPSSITLRDYQIEAVRNWMRNNGRGVLKMATGSGKTITSLSAAAELVDHIDLEALIIVCPFRHLVTQWDRECRRFGARPILAFESRHRWASQLSTQLYNLSSRTGSFLCVVTTNTTFASSGFQNQLQHFPKRTLLIADEVHNLGAEKLRRALPENIRLRIGLSATPERWFDDTGTQGIFNYFGPVLEPEFTIRDALEAGALVPYRYLPVLVELNDDERDEYLDLSERITKMFTYGDACLDGTDDNPALQILLSKRARLIAVAHNKMAALRHLVASRSDWKHTLFYCGDGTITDDSDQSGHETILRHVHAVCKVLGGEMNLRVAPYTYETSLEEREELRRRLDSGDLDGLVAIRCLDEGVDIPSVRTAVILASSTNPRQFIQRRGRVLRPAPNKKTADVYDMIVAPPLDVKWSDAERQLMKKELTRFVEFADLAMNSGEARSRVLSLQDHFQLLDM